MTLEEVRIKAAGMIEERTGTSRDALLADTPFAQLGYDSLAVLEIGFSLEEALHLDFEGELTAQNLPRTLTDLARVLHAQLSSQRGPKADGTAPSRA